MPHVGIGKEPSHSLSLSLSLSRHTHVGIERLGHIPRCVPPQVKKFLTLPKTCRDLYFDRRNFQFRSRAEDEEG